MSLLNMRYPIAIGGVVALLVGLYSAGSILNSEELYNSFWTTHVAVRAIAAGDWWFWTDRLGFGMPQPFAQNFLLTPVTPLFYITNFKLTATALLLLELTTGAFCFWQLVRYLGAAPGAAFVGTVSYLCSGGIIQHTYAYFGPTAVDLLTLAPLQFLLLLKLFDADASAERRLYALGLGLVSGYIVWNSHPGHLVVWTVGVAIWLVCRGRKAVQRIGYLAAAAAIAILASAEKIYLIVAERQWFLLGHTEAKEFIAGSNISQWAFDFLARPFSWPDFSALYEGVVERGPLRGVMHFIALLASVYTSSPTYFVGAVFAWLAIGMAIWVLWRCDSLWPLAVMFVVSTLLIFTPSWIFFNLPPEMWVFRDPAAFAAIVLATLALTRFFAQKDGRLTRVGLVLCGLQLAALAGGIFPQIFYILRGGFLGVNDQFMTQSAPDAPIVQAMRSAGVTQGSRLLLSPEIQLLSRSSRISGIDLNTLGLRGFDVVNGEFKGISTDIFEPARKMMVGKIDGSPRLLADGTALNVLGINYVLALSRETVAPGLSEISSYHQPTSPWPVLDRRLDVKIYANSAAWPHAVFVRPEARDVELPVKPGCGHDRLLCRDFAPLVALKTSDPAPRMKSNRGRVSLTFAPASARRLLFISEMYRPEWQADAGGQAVNIFPIARGFIGVDVPAGVRSIQLRYWPVIRVVLLTVSLATFAVGGLALWIMLRRRRRSRSALAAEVTA